MSARSAQNPPENRKKNRKIRLFVREPLAPGSVITLDRDQSRYVQRVMRRQAGDTVLLFNGRDGEWQGGLEGCAKNTCSVVVTEQTRIQRQEPDIALIFAPVKKSRLDFMVEKATELGVSRLCPVFTGQTAVTRINTDRLQAIALEAAEQCERLTVPEVDEAAALAAFLQDWPENQTLLFMDESGHGKSLADVREQADAPALAADAPAGILVGPEGGFSPAELDALGKLPFSVAVTLGPRVLRTETAALAALALWQLFCGDGRDTRPR